MPKASSFSFLIKKSFFIDSYAAIAAIRSVLIPENLE